MSVAVLNKDLFKNVESRSKEYKGAAPFPHGTLDPLCQKDFLASVREEVFEQDLTAKETDLYRLRQSVDLSNLTPEALKQQPEIAESLKHVLQLRDALYSKEFRDLVSDISGCGELSTKVDLAASLYTNGSHLLLHDDVISTRKVAFIVYLTEPDAEGEEEPYWMEEDGGCLELYPEDPKHVQHPATTPTKRILPRFNRFAFFTVEAGKSFHAVQEVFAMEKDRLSIQGWFHSPTVTNIGDSVAPLKQLKNDAEPFVGKMEKVLLKSAVKDGNVELDEKMIMELQRLGLHQMYFDPNNLAQLSDEFAKHGVVRLGSLLQPPLVDPLLESLRAIDEADAVGLGQPTPPADDAGVDANWTVRGPTHIRRHLELVEDPVDSDDEEGARPKKAKKKSKVQKPVCPAAAERKELVMMLSCIRDRLMKSEAFATFISAITGGKLNEADFTGRYTAARRFRPGLDYTLATIPHTEPLLEVVYSLCNGIAPGDDEECEEGDDEEEVMMLEEGQDLEDLDDEAGFWDSCEVGGFDSYIKAEADTTAGSVMSATVDKDKVQNLPCESNCLSIVLRTPDMMHFTKYVQAAAPGSRLDVLQVYTLSK